MSALVWHQRLFSHETNATTICRSTSRISHQSCQSTATTTTTAFSRESTGRPDLHAALSPHNLHTKVSDTAQGCAYPRPMAAAAAAAAARSSSIRISSTTTEYTTHSALALLQGHRPVSSAIGGCRSQTAAAHLYSPIAIARCRRR